MALHSITRFLLLFLTVHACQAMESVTLQLKWEHEFQFAGYYAAKWQGYYSDAGIDVEIKSAFEEDGTYLSPTEQVSQGKADFAIGSLDILLERDRGNELVVLAPIFQRSPVAVFALDSTPIDSLSQLAKLRIGAATSQAARIELEALFRARGFNYDKLQFVDAPVAVTSLVSGEVDAIFTYEISASRQAKELGVRLNKLHPADYGLNFYGDTLFTSSKIAKGQPALARAFTKASIKGWLYALNNKEAIAKKIAETLPRYQIKYDDLLAYNLAFANITESLMEYPQTPIGYSSRNKWFAMNDRIRRLGIIQSHLNVNGFIFEDQFSQPTYVMAPLFVIPFGLALLIFFWRHQSLIPTALATFLTISLTGYEVWHLLQSYEKNDNQRLLREHLYNVSNALEGRLNQNLSMISGLAAHISAIPQLPREDFDSYAAEMFKKDSMLISIAAAKDLKISHIYPYKGNEKALGLNYRKHPVQWTSVEQVIKTGQMVVDGPVELVQGGQAFIGRAPVYTGTDTNRYLWGIVSAPLDANALLHHPSLSPEHAIQIAIRNSDSSATTSPPFIGSAATFESPHAAKTVINVGVNTWELAAVSPAYDESLARQRFIVTISSLILSLLIIIAAQLRFRYLQEKRALLLNIQSQQRLLEKVGQLGRIGGWKLDSSLSITQWSKQACTALHLPEHFLPQNLIDLSFLFSPKDFSLLKNKVQNTFDRHETFDIELPINLPDNSEGWIRALGNMGDSLDEKHLMIGTLQDITDEVKNHQLIEHQANFDALTDLPNRTLFNDRLAHAIAEASRSRTLVGILFIDLDQFKPVNDNHGHAAGDKLLQLAAQRIADAVRESDTVSRLSGDEFAVFLTHIHDFRDILRTTEQIHEEMQKPFDLNDITVHCSASIGIAIYPNDGQRAPELLRKADQAMYEVKSSGRNSWQFYTQAMQEKSERRHQLHNALITAVDKGQLDVFLQPIFELNSGRIAKAEALVRWFDESHHFIPPDEFIPIAEETGLINRIDLFVMQTAGQFLASMTSQGQPIELTVNISPRLFQTKDKALEQWQESIKQLRNELPMCVEITERLLTDDSITALDVLNGLKEQAINIAIDDFGTGYSSLSYLMRFPVSCLKIDRSFVQSIHNDKASDALIETILVMAQRLELEVVAEGIETQEQLDFLKERGCTYGQGYFLGKPSPRKAFSEQWGQQAVGSK
jgi:diguanylate cyclase (GGDEF)-like protein